MATKTGNCMYCGQSKMIEVPEDMSEDNVCYEVTKQCDCPSARMMRNKEEQKGRCIANIDSLLEVQHPEIAGIFKDSIYAIQNHKIKKITISTYDNQTARMYECKDGIKVELEKKKKEEELA